MTTPGVSVESGLVPDNPPVSIGSQLCTQCGLCCTGALHDTATADPGELESLRSMGFNLLDETRKPRFSLPCTCLSGTRCTIYGSRPRVCSHYRCRLLQDLEAGAIEPADALAKVREGRRLFEMAKALLPPGRTIPQARAMCRNGDPEHQLRLMALTRYLDLHFRNDEEGTLLDAEVLTMVGPKTMKEGGEQHV